MTSSNHKFHAAAFSDRLDDFDAARELTRDYYRENVTAALSGDDIPFRDKLIDVITNLHVDLFLAMSRADERMGILPPSLHEAVTLLPPMRLRQGVSSLAPSLGPKLVGRGWHQPEPVGSGSFSRWSGPGCLSSIFLPRLVSGSYVLGGEVRFLRAEAADAFRIRIGEGDFTAPQLQPSSPDFHKFEITLPYSEDARSTFTVLEFFCEKLGKPADIEIHNPDQRVLGFWLSELYISKVD